MFDLGFSELLVIAVVALIVLGPERLPKAARFAGLWVRRARAQWSSVKDELERDMAAEEFKRSLQETKDALRDTERSIHQSGEEARKEFEQMRAAVASEGAARVDEDRPLESSSISYDDMQPEDEASETAYDADEEARHELERRHAMTRDAAQAAAADEVPTDAPASEPTPDQDRGDGRRA